METHFKENLFSIIGAYYQLKPESLETISSNCKITSFNTSTFLAEVGKRDLYEYFILDGIVQRYVIDSEGQPITTGFYMPHSIITPHFARTIKIRSILYLQCLTNVTTAQIPVDIFRNLRYSHTDIGNFAWKVFERELSLSLSNEVAHRSLSARDRLISLRKNYPNIENMIPHSYIASFLGVTPVSFSRLRNELARKC